MSVKFRECNKYRSFILALFIVLIFAGHFLFSKSSANSRKPEHVKEAAYNVNKDVETFERITKQPVEEVFSKIEEDDFPKHDKWIVTTTINKPTEQMTKLIKNEEWRMVVVGDVKTPIEWKLPNTVFLSVKRQEKFGGHLSKLVPFKSYFRKNVGYIYAIKHGARTILDVDDDNEIAIDAFEFNDLSSSLTPVTNESFYNPYPHFGQSTLWPRGYPLQKIGDPQPRHYRTITGPTPAIQQAVVDGDPDMDAIFRLTRKNAKRMLDLTFDRSAPSVVLRKNLYAPCNAQATLWRYEAFWGLFFYGSVTWREADIFRCYWAQRLLWYTKSRLAFFPPAAVQVRNPHDYLIDYMDERRLYEITEKFVSALKSLDCTSNFEACLRKSATHMKEMEFWTQNDVDWLNAWVDDLNDIEYKFPDLEVSDENINEDVVFFPREQDTSFNHNPSLEPLSSLLPFNRVVQTVSKVCGSNYTVAWNPEKFNNDTLLVIGLTSGQIEKIPLLDAVYRPYYSNVIYCTSIKPTDTFSVSILQTKSVDVLSCLKNVYELGYTVKSYIYANEEFLFFPKSLLKYKGSRTLFEGSVNCKETDATNRSLNDKFFKLSSKSLGQIKTDCYNKKCIKKFLGDTFCNPDFNSASLDKTDYKVPFDIFKNTTQFCNIFKKFV